MTAEAERMNASEIDGNEFVELMDELCGEMQIAVDWIDVAFGELEADAAKFGPLAALRAGFSRLFAN